MNNLNTVNLLEGVFNQLLSNPRSSAATVAVQQELKSEFEKHYGKKNYFLISSSGSNRAANESEKLIALHHSAVINSANRVNSYYKLDRSMNWGCVLPWFHVAGLGILTRAFKAQAKVFTLIWDQSQVGTIASWIVKNNIHLLSLVPTQVFDLIQNKIQAPINLKYVFVGGSKLDIKLKAEIIKLGWPILETYGLTETASMVAFGESENLRLLPDVEIALDDSKLKIKCDSLMTCSLQKIDNKIEIKTLNNGWLHTDDRAEISMQGQNTVLKLIGRDLDYLKINGEGVSLFSLRQLLKQLLNRHEGLYLLAFPNERREFEIVLVIEKQMAREDVVRVVNQFNSQVKPYEKIKKWYQLDAIPRTELGKIQYKILEDNLKGLPHEEV